MTTIRDDHPTGDLQDQPLRCAVAPDAVSKVIRIEGELDFETACIFSSIVEVQIAQEKVDLVVDVSRLRFIDAAGLRSLRTARQHLRAHGGSLSVVGYGVLFGELARLCDLADVLVAGSGRQSIP